MQKNPKDMNFDKSAARYDGVMGRASDKFYRLLITQAALTKDAAVLDAGCGTGEVLRRMAEICPIRGHGIDMSAQMAAEARRKNPGMDIRVARSEQTPFADNAFDVVIACMAYHHFSDRAGFIQEAARILRPGGLLVVADPNFPGIVRAVANAFFKAIRVAGAFFTPEEMFRDFAAHGFEADGFVKDGLAQVVKMRRKAQ